MGKTYVQWAYVIDDDGSRYIRIQKLGLLGRLSILFFGRLNIGLQNFRLVPTDLG